MVRTLVPPPLPDGCIRGPVVSTVEVVRDALAATPTDALAAYADGVVLLVRLQTLLKQRAALAALQQERAFVAGQLATLERQHGKAVRAQVAVHRRRSS